jgi:hypothetical protein
MPQFPSTTSASDVWALIDVYRARAGNNWPSTATVPSAPTIGTATAGNAQATVTFTPPTSDGGSPITGYRVTSSPGGITATGSASPITITGLTNGTAYTFTVAAQNLVGYGPESAASNSVTPTAVNKTSSVDYLVVAGGGAGGYGRSSIGGGGGGAGGYRTATSFSVSSGSAITVTVGAGAAAQTDGTIQPSIGSNSVFSTITSIGGGSGNHYPYNDSNGNRPPTGGSGGGSARSDNTYGFGTVGQGYDGGSQDNGDEASGGGGASAVGGNASSGNYAGNGGAGASSSISGSSVTYAGGGGGGARSSRTVGSGGAGGGGSGGNDSGVSPTAGTANTGGGGGGGGGFSNTSRAGGSGIVIIRYPNTFDDAVATTGSPSFSNTGGYKIYTWTGSGSITF